MGRWRVAVALLLFLVPAVHRAQTTGDIQGRVSDSAGGALPGVAVEATSPSLQGTRTAVTGRDGEYHFPATPPGSYRIRAAISGFHAEDKTATVSLDATATVDFILHPTAEEQVVVSGEAPPIDVTSTTTGTNYTSGVIGHLPVGRNYADIVRANPGVSTDQEQMQGRSLALSIYGATSVENQWIIDGINTTNVQNGTQGKTINNEFVQEVEVKTGGYQAAYGRALGGVINVITKSGGNQFHGDAFLYYDELNWTASQEVTPQDSVIDNMKVDDYERTDFGLDLGGFLLRDRLWFFGAYDRVNLTAKVSGYISSPYVSPSDQFPLDGTDNLYSGKLTWNIGTGTTLVGTIFSDPTSNKGAAGSDPRQGFGGIYVPPITNRDPTTWYSTREIGAIDFGVRLNQMFGPRALLTLQGARHQDQYSLVAPDLVRTLDYTCTGGTPEKPCEQPGDPFVTGGYGFVQGPNNHSRSSRDQYRADLNLYLGSHEVTLGGDYARASTEAFTYRSGGSVIAIYNERGVTYYQHRFYAVSPLDLTPIPGVTSIPRTNEQGAYIQDSWRLAPGWTLNLGLRWDQERLKNYADVTVIHTMNEWQPRIGVVWDPWKDGATKVYAFAGRFYYSLPTSVAMSAWAGFTNVLSYNFDPSPSDTAQDPNVPGHPKAQVRGSASGDVVDAGLRAIYQDEYTLGVERSLGPSLTLGLKGTYRSRRNIIEDRCDLDYTAPVNNGSGCGIMNPGSSGPIARGAVPGCDGLGDAYQCTETIPPTPRASRIYKGIELLARKSVGERLWLQASYIYSSLRGNYAGADGLSVDFDYPELYHDAYGRLFLDRPHRFRFDGYYVTPFRLSVGLQAWAVSGAPLDRLGFIECCGSAIHLVPRGYAGRLPTEWEANLTLGYPIAIGPVTVTLQGYVYNLFNNQIATGRDTNWTVSEPADYPASLYDPNQPSDNPDYGKITGRQEPRSFRAAVRVSF